MMHDSVRLSGSTQLRALRACFVLMRLSTVRRNTVSTVVMRVHLQLTRKGHRLRKRKRERDDSNELEKNRVA